MFNPTSDISEVAIAAISETMENYASGTRASILFAQMQSGKTIAFLLLAGEMLRTKMVDNIVIFTGNREKELKKQLHTQVKGNELELSFFDTKYMRYLDQVGLNINPWDQEELIKKIIEEIKQKIVIIWGTDLIKKAYRVTTENTLFIFEESHFAQTIGQSPSKFLEIIGLPANGDVDMLEEKNNYYCSISATPFSELCDNGNLEQSKKIIRMTPGSGYRGVKWLKESNKIIGYDNWETALGEALYNKKDECNWSIVRVRGSEQLEVAERICQRAEWAVRRYDQEHSGITSMKALEQKPETSTIVILRERCRMGTVVPKDHLAFLFETSTSSKTDTLLQGLLGRACGYHQNDSIQVYINEELLKTGEIERYLDLCKGYEKRVPTNAKNVVKEDDLYRLYTSNNGGKMYQVIPIHIPKRCITVSTKPKDRTLLIEDILNGLALDEEVIQNNQNPEPIRQKIIDELEALINTSKADQDQDQPLKINLHRLIGNDNKTFRGIPGKISDAIKFKKPTRFGSGCGGWSLYHVDKPIDGMETNSFYLCCYLELTEQQLDELKSKKIQNSLPSTTCAEIFRYRNFLETGEVEFTNGGFCLSLRPETATDENVMLETIRECVLRSKETETYLVVPSRINSIRQPGFDKFTGIFASVQVYSSLMFGGNIYNAIKDEFGVVLKLTKNKGRPTKMPTDCAVRLAEISW
jgi:hypothetical protein